MGKQLNRPSVTHFCGEQCNFKRSDFKSAIKCDVVYGTGMATFSSSSGAYYKSFQKSNSFMSRRLMGD